MPDRLSYDEAMLFSSARLRIQDPELKQGHVETLITKTTVGVVERPWGVEGGFAVVYKFRTRSGKLRALRCFRVPVDPSTQFRYERIGPYFQAHARDITVEFKYHPIGIAVKEQGRAGQQVYPVIEMDWVEGVTLTERVDVLCRKRDSAALKQLGQQWLALLATLRQARIAHGDLAGPNVMVKPDGQLVLIDYDGVYIPEFAGFRQMLLGQADYQHPQKSQRKFNKHMDDFSALVIHTALFALEVQPALWDKYAKRDAQGKLLDDTSLLFTQQDFREPFQSPLMQELAELGDAQVTSTAKELQRACLQSIDRVRFPYYLIDSDYEKRPLQAALQSRNVEQIAAAYEAAPNLAQYLTEKERQQAELAVAFVKACATEDDKELAAAYDAIENFRYLGTFILTPRQIQRAKLAQQRRAALARFRVALSSKKIQQIAAAYDPVLDASKNVSVEEREQLTLAHAFAKACTDDNNDELIIAYDAIQHSAHQAAFIFTAQEQQRVTLAQRQKEALITFRIALRGKKPREIAAAYDEVLHSSKSITRGEREQLALARDFAHAYESDDDRALAAMATALRHRPLFDFTPQELQRLLLARQRQAALEPFQQAVAAPVRNAHQIVAAYDASMLDTHNWITQEQQALVAAARSYLTMYQVVQRGIAEDSDDMIRKAYDKALAEQFADFSPDEQRRVDRAVLPERVEELLACKEYGEAIRIALDIQTTARLVLSNRITFKLQKAIIHFVRQNDLADLTVQIEERLDRNYAVVHWKWPEYKLIKDALIVWSPDAWLPRLQGMGRLSSGGRHVWVQREDDQDEGRCEFPIERDVPTYVQGYAAMLDPWAREERWRFGNGADAIL